MIIRLYDGYGGYHDHDLPDINQYIPQFIFWHGFLYSHIGNGHYKPEHYYFISPNDKGIKGGQR
jgi:hypothetical protein